jgi:hypothetical protein
VTTEAPLPEVPDEVLSWTGYPDRPLGTRVPRDLSEARLPSIVWTSPVDRAANFQEAMVERPNVYVRRVRKALGLRPTGAVHRHDLLRLPVGCLTSLNRVGQRAQPEPARRRFSPLEVMALVAAGAMAAFMAFFGGRR